MTYTETYPEPGVIRRTYEDGTIIEVDTRLLPEDWEEKVKESLEKAREELK